MIFLKEEEKEPFDVIVVLGAAVWKGGMPSPVKCGAYFSGARDKQDPFRVTIMPTSLGVTLTLRI
ncbi:MAG: hypothetical protein JRE28_12215 [Deltaproteobacteria bacterium]|nr:hypothetical protein [Deltaproteobacteria bacterium]